MVGTSFRRPTRGRTILDDLGVDAVQGLRLGEQFFQLDADVVLALTRAQVRWRMRRDGWKRELPGVFRMAWSEPS